MTNHEVYKACAKNEIVGKDEVCEHWKHKYFQSFSYSCQFKDNFDPFMEIVHLLPTIYLPPNQPGTHELSTLQAY